jgi:2-keto-4-pentenoate hydratase/2-oxohepta-3-ene-1,7-dioic acid hydratase in catechol pathway
MQRFRYQSAKGAVWGELERGQLFELSFMMGSRTGQTHLLSEVVLLAPCEPTKLVCVGKNYAKHIKEMGGGDLPKEPGIFLKGINALSNPGDPIPYPEWTNELHYEGELAVVIAKQMKNVSEDDALKYVLGYTCACDVTARDKQKSDLQWTRGKASDKFCPVGPWLETDLDTSHLSVQTRVNGELKQDGNTEDLIFSVPVILSYISSFMTLEPGDVVLTGTPDGVGPLKIGDTVEVTVEGIGTLTNIVEGDNRV